MASTLNSEMHWLMESAAPLPKNLVHIPVVKMVLAHDCYCVCVWLNDRFRLALWRTNDDSAIFLKASFSEQPLLQIAKARQEHSCWFVYVVDNHPSEKTVKQPQLLAWEITARSFSPQGNDSMIDSSTAARIPPGCCVNVWPDHLLPQDDLKVTSLAVLQPEDIPKPILLFGTACGVPLWSTQISIPMDFHIQKVEATAQKQQSLLARGLSLVTYQPPTTCIVSMIPTVSSTSPGRSAFVVVCADGKMCLYEFERMNEIRFQADCFVMNLLQEHFANTQDPLYDMQVELATALQDKIFLVCLVQHSEANEPTRYWIVVQDDALQAVSPLPDRVIAYEIGSDGTVYAVLDHADGTQSVATLDLQKKEIMTHTLVQTSLQSGIMCPDHTTHGMLLLPNDASSLLRARYFSSSQRDESELPIASMREIDTLRSLFETWYSVETPTAISVTMQNPYLQAAVLPLAKTVHETFRNPLERHLAYVRFLQDIGLYKFLPEATKWSLLAIGQNLQVSQVIRPMTSSAEQIIAPESVEDILVRMQQSNSPQWLDCLHAVLKAASDHRHNYASPDKTISYDIINADDALPGLLWTSAILKSVLQPQLEIWEALPNGIESIGEPQSYLDVLRWILEAFRDHGETVTYANASKMVFRIVRRSFRKRQDKWLFQLCVDHRYYEGVMKIHREYTPRAQFELTCIENKATTDIETNLPFKHYALKWLAEHEAVGLALPLHEIWTDEFYEVAETTPNLKPYQWMVDSIRGHHNKLAEDIYQRFVSTNDLTLSDATIFLGACFGSNEIVLANDSVNRERALQRRPSIEKKQDLLQILYRFDPRPTMFLSPSAAVNKVMRRICDDSVSTDITDFSMALEICTTFDSYDDAKGAALMVWTKAILADKDAYLRWTKKETDVTAPHILREIRKSTIFGQLLEYSDDSAVAWTNNWEDIKDVDDIFKDFQLRRMIASCCKSPHPHEEPDMRMIEG